jgi:peptidoglycan/xylan/chitin deacetylase (PgdA/CDA1 family)
MITLILFMRKMLRVEKAIAYGIYFSGIYFVYSKIADMASSSGRILMYHRILNEGEDLSGVNMVTKKAFERQMRIICEKYNPVSMYELVEGIKNGNLRKGSVAITLDDGYRDNYLNAYPILKRYGIPATIFLTSGIIGTHDMLWFDKVSASISLTHKKKLYFEGKSFNLSEKKSREVANQSIVSILKNMEHKSRLKSLDNLMETLNITKDMLPKDMMLEWNHVKEMSESGLITFGAHTLTHPILTQLSMENIKKEIFDSKDIIEKIISKKVDLFSYPNGDKSDFNEDIKNLLRRAFICSSSTIPGKNDSKSDLFELRRIGCSHENNDIVFKVKQSGILNCLIGIYKYVKGR